VPASPTSLSRNAVVAYAPRTLDPLERIVRAYDRAIDACESFNVDEARQAIGLLRAALDLDGPASRSFDALYAWCEEAVDGRDFVGPARTLRALRDAWCLAGQPSPIVTRKDWPVS
jgi:hypothetical protein